MFTVSLVPPYPQPFLAILRKLNEEITRGLRVAVAPWVLLSMQNASPIDTGAFMYAWGTADEKSGGISIFNTKDYAPILEDGLYPGVGKKTVAFGGGIFSNQAKGGVIAPFMEEDRNLDEIANDCMDFLMSRIESA